MCYYLDMIIIFLIYIMPSCLYVLFLGHQVTMAKRSLLTWCHSMLTKMISIMFVDMMSFYSHTISLGWWQTNLSCLFLHTAHTEIMTLPLQPGSWHQCHKWEWRVSPVWSIKVYTYTPTKLPTSLLSISLLAKSNLFLSFICITLLSVLT